MSRYLERQPNQKEIQAGDLNSRSFFIVEKPDEEMYNASLLVRDTYSDITPFKKLEVAKQIGERDCISWISTTVTTGEVPKYRDSWRWMINVQSESDESILICDVTWGESNWEQIGRWDQGRLWRGRVNQDTFCIEDRDGEGPLAYPRLVQRGLDVVWHYIKRDHQGGLRRKGFINDPHGFLAGFIRDTLADSDIEQKAFELRSKRAVAEAEHLANPPPYYQQLDKIKPHYSTIGFVGLGLKKSQHVSPEFVKFRDRSEKVYEIADLPADVKFVIADDDLGFKAHTTKLEDPEEEGTTE